MIEDLKSLSDGELTSEGDKAWQKGDSSRLEAIKAEKARRAVIHRAATQGMPLWMKVICWIAIYIVGCGVAAAIGIGGWGELLIGACAAGGLTPVVNNLVKKSQRQKAEKANA